jgi:hypothetical protein
MKQGGIGSTPFFILQFYGIVKLKWFISSKYIDNCIFLDDYISLNVLIRKEPPPQFYRGFFYTYVMRYDIIQYRVKPYLCASARLHYIALGVSINRGRVMSSIPPAMLRWLCTQQERQEIDN